MCQSCIAECASCTLSDPYNCSSCQADFYLYGWDCYSYCPAGTYADPYAKQCMECNSLCSTCANATNCTACIPGYFLFNWFCFDSCPTIPTLYYSYNGQCVSCRPQCVSCLDSPV